MKFGEKTDRTGARERAYTAEYVELKTEIRDLSGALRAEMSKLLAKMESTEHYMRDLQREMARLDHLVHSNRESLASLKMAATVVGGLAGLAVSFLARLFSGTTGV